MDHSLQTIGKCTVSSSLFFHDNEIEYALIFSSSNDLKFDEQLLDIQQALLFVFQSESIEKEYLRFARFYVSDVVNQQSLIVQSELYSFLQEETCISIIQQPPLNHSKITLFLRLTKSHIIEKVKHDNILWVKDKHDEYLWTSDFELPPALNSYDQSAVLLQNLQTQLKVHNATLSEHCVRTWFYVTNIDKNYMAMVEARKKYFTEINLTPLTHFIASTGIEGKSCNPRRTVAMESFSVPSLKRTQITYLNVPDYMNSTHEYGVTFERATQLEFKDYKQILISGTASIDNKGDILFVNDISAQLERAMQNIEALLKLVESSHDDVLYYVVYLRDFNDYAIIKKLFDKKYTHKPAIIVLAPVCRPGWLIEIECEAFTK